MDSCDLLIDEAAQVVTVAGRAPRLRGDLDAAGVIQDGAIAVTGERIVAVGPARAIRERFAPKKTLSARGGTVLPGFVDAHTHPVFARTREAEYDLRLRGATYQQITAAGGGIFSSVTALRATADDVLVALVRSHFDRFLRGGTTTIEAKSGYGLTTDDELRSLEALRAVAASHPLEVAATFLGAHQMPKEFAGRRADYLRLLVDEMLPEVKRRGLAEACDVFADDGAYDVAEARTLLEGARAQGFALRVHSDELANIGATELAASLGAKSCDHLCRISGAGIEALAASGTTAVLLPGTVLSLGMKAVPPARRMIDSGCAVALGTDFNPGTSYVTSMVAVIALACSLLRMTVAEALTAATLNAAHSLGRADRIGSIEQGKQADLVVLDRPSYLFLGYELGADPVAHVIKRGAIVHSRSEGR